MINVLSTPYEFPINSFNDISFTDLIDLKKIQAIQDIFADTHGVASIITKTDGTPITNPSKFTRLCSEIIRKTEKGCEYCFKSHALLGQYHPEGPVVLPCLSVGLWDAGASITVGGKQIANWLIGQVRNEALDQTRMMKFADEIEVDRKVFQEALNEVPVMSHEKFQKIAKLLFLFANELSEKAFTSFQLKQESLKREKVIDLLRESEKKYRLIAENTADSLAVLDFNLNYTFLSPSIFNLLGYSPEEMMTLKFQDISTPETSQTALHILGEEMEIERSGTADPKRNRTIIIEQIRKDGHKIWVESAVSFIRDENGEPVNILAIVRDISKRKQMEETLRMSESIQKKMVANIAHVIVIIDKDGINKYKSPNIENLFGWNPEELIGESTWKNVHPQDLEYMQDFFNSLTIEPDKSSKVECRYRCKDGSYKWIEFKGKNLFNDPEINGILGNYHDITEIKLAEKALKHSHDLMHYIIEHNRTAVAIHDRDLKYIYVSQRYLQEFNIKEQDIIGKHHYEVFSDLPQKWRKVHQRSLAGEILSAEDDLYLRDDGTMDWTRWECRPWYEPDGEIGGIVVYTEITTERKQVEIQLQESEERWRRAVADSPVPIMIHDEDDNVLQLSAGWTKFSGYTIDDIPTLADWTERAYGERSGFKKDYFDQLFSIDQTVDNGEWIVRAKDGSKKIWVFQTTPLGKIQGKKRVLHSMAVDITERKRSEEAVRESEQRFLTFMNNTSVFAWMKDEDLKYVFLNKAFEDQQGITLKDVQGKDDFAIYDKQIAEILQSNDRKVLSSGEILTTEEIVEDRFGQLKHSMVYKFLVHGLLGKRYIGGMSIDITGLKIMEADLILSKEKAEESDRLKSAFLANMSHEIRTPLNSIIGFSELLNDPDFDQEQKTEFTRTIVENGNQLMLIISDVLDLSMIAAGQMKIRSEGFSAQKLLVELENEFKIKAYDKGIDLRLLVLSENPELIIQSDAYRIKQILTNFIGNAIKFTSQGFVEFGYLIKGENIDFQVKDSGIGIAAEHLETIFDRFRQVELSKTRRFGGNGLGLSISKNLAELLGGKIWVESELGKGSTFHFSIPIHSKSNENNVTPDKIETSTKEIQISNLKILIAEDEVDSSKLISIKVQKFAKEIISVKTGTKAVEACRNNPDIELILMDIQMPEMDGYEATRQIRKFNKKVIIIAQTAYAFAGDREKALEAGCNDYISKPIKRDELKELIQKYFKK